MVHYGTGQDTCRLLRFLSVDNQSHPFKARNPHGFTHRKFIARLRIPKLASQQYLSAVPRLADNLCLPSLQPFNACGNWPSEVFPHFPREPKKDEKKWNRNKSCRRWRQEQESSNSKKRKQKKDVA